MLDQGVKEFFEDVENSIDYKVEGAKIDFSLELQRFMEQSGMKKVDLAARLGVSRPMITKLLRGDSNVTIETMVRACDAVGGKFFVKIVRQTCTPRMLEVVKSDNIPSNVKVKRALTDSHYGEFKHKWMVLPPVKANLFHEAKSATA